MRFKEFRVSYYRKWLVPRRTIIRSLEQKRMSNKSRKTMEEYTVLSLREGHSSQIGRYCAFQNNQAELAVPHNSAKGITGWEKGLSGQMRHQGLIRLVQKIEFTEKSKLEQLRKKKKIKLEICTPVPLENFGNRVLFSCGKK